MDPRETRASRAIYDGCEAAILIGSVTAARLIGEARHASFVGMLLAIALGGVSGGLIWLVCRRSLARRLAGAFAKR